MALLNTIDVEDVTRKLRDWPGPRLSEAADTLTVTNVAIPHAAGFSMTTVLFDAKWVDDESQERELHLVCRVAPATPGLLEHADLAKEFSLLRTLNESTDIKVPTVRWLEEDGSVLGAPFVVMDRVFGEIPSDDPP
jgi:aminoglycoside phosphotransferase (APT) family kinase protein